MQILVTRFHLLLLIVTLAITGVAAFRVPADFLYLAHWQGNSPDWVWPRWIIIVAPLVQIMLLAIFFLLARLLTRNQYAKSQHILDPALTVLLSVVAATQLGLLLTGVGSDLDFVRFTAFALGAALLPLAVVLFEAKRHTYAGMRVPWPIRSDRAWKVVHRATGLSYVVAGVSLLAVGWLDVGLGILVVCLTAAMLVPPAIAAFVTLVWYVATGRDRY